jgi:hypothetical protein
MFWTDIEKDKRCNELQKCQKVKFEEVIMLLENLCSLVAGVSTLKEKKVDNGDFKTRMFYCMECIIHEVLQHPLPVLIEEEILHSAGLESAQKPQPPIQPTQ